MSKMDGLRAMREAKYAQAQARARAAGPATTRPKAASTDPDAAPAKPARKRAPAKPKQTSAEASPSTEASTEAGTEELCGHRNMSGRTCTRERGHAAKSHRYS
ncbi:hypothetical protein JK386_03140 [Nocardioides sp. zg-536]|uniref:Uncharacterized protein n=1 Tax=Nocardioides faecalis TaxID=2803858 RepID=A0A938Y2Q4_9ACTN|nr:hypothetical protein [Nocardioides faecalis]MBM9458883.1 hypothetical protein [Nocardioides faecalis]QVI60287.1 hypothetical protein KG111_08400 [Nocardioides faecalis]